MSETGNEFAKPHEVTTVVFRALLDWWMGSDPWPMPQGDKTHGVVKDWLNAVAEHHGYEDWVVAFHEVPRA